jgi:hypothetical protein
MAATSAGNAENIKIFGQVRGFDFKPIMTIKVTVYSDQEELNHVFTDAQGRYSIAGPAGQALTIRFDTHHSITNSREWHPSVVANIEANKDTSLDRFLMRVGFVESETAAVDALAAYQFAAMWGAEREYAESAGARLGQIKFTTRTLVEISTKLRDHFSQLAKNQ